MNPLTGDTQQETTKLVCNQIFFACICKLEKEHKGPHECDCEGSWSGEKGAEQVVRFPNLTKARGYKEET